MTANVVKRPHQIVMTWADEQFSPAFELLLSLADGGQDQAIDAAAVLMNPVNKLPDRARLDIDVQRAKKSPQPAGHGHRQHHIEPLAELRRRRNVAGDHRGIGPEHLRHGKLQVLMLADTNHAVTARTGHQDRLMRGREHRRQQEANIEMPDALFQRLVLAVQNVGRRRGEFADQEQIATPDLIGADAAQPFAPFCRNLERRAGENPKIGRDPLRRHRPV